MPQQESHFRVLSTATIVLWGVGLVLVAGIAVVVLSWAVGPSPMTSADLVGRAGSVAVGMGSLATLLLAVRKQRNAELDMRQREHDAAEHRLTDLYKSAADQLGSDKAPVRLAGLYALERLAQDSPAHRQTIVNLICAYLRMPFEPPADGRSDESQVRLTVQGLLAAHLRPDEQTAFWSGIELNLSGATLVKFALTNCTVRSALFNQARFVDSAIFRGTTIEHSADFRHVRFGSLADFRRVSFGDDDRGFRGAVFEGEVDFGTTTTATLTGARVLAGQRRRKWPSGWTEQNSQDEPAMKCLVTS